MPLVAGVLVLGLFGLCLMQVRSCAKTVYGPISFTDRMRDIICVIR